MRGIATERAAQGGLGLDAMSVLAIARAHGRAGAPWPLAEAMAARRQGGSFRMQKGYDHSYFFVSSFMEEHIAFHAQALHG